MPKGFTQHEKKLINERLLEQGNKQFSAFGLKKTNVEELARAAGISKGAFYLFYDSKETLFMQVVEQAEKHFRQDVLAEIDLPGSSPRLRLYTALKKAFSLWKTIPLLQAFTGSDYEVLRRRIPADVIQEHMHSDFEFVEEFMQRCRAAGIMVQAPAERINGLFHTLFFASLHEDDLGQEGFSGSIDVLLQLTAAYCLNEVVIHEPGD